MKKRQLIALLLALTMLLTALAGCSKTENPAEPPKADNSAEAAGTEFEIAVEGILEAHRVIVPEFEDFALGFRVEISVQPALGDFFVRFSHECKNNLVLYMLSVCDY